VKRPTDIPKLPNIFSNCPHYELRKMAGDLPMFDAGLAEDVLARAGQHSEGPLQKSFIEKCRGLVAVRLRQHIYGLPVDAFAASAQSGAYHVQAFLRDLNRKDKFGVSNASRHTTFTPLADAEELLGKVKAFPIGEKRRVQTAYFYFHGAAEQPNTVLAGAEVIAMFGPPADIKFGQLLFTIGLDAGSAARFVSTVDQLYARYLTFTNPGDGDLVSLTTTPHLWANRFNELEVEFSMCWCCRFVPRITPAQEAAVALFLEAEV